MAKKDKELEKDEEKSDMVPMIRGAEFDKKYVTRAIPFLTEFDIRITISNEIMDTGEGWFTVVDQMLIMTPTAAKELVRELNEIVEAYEEINGPIKERPPKKLLTSFTRRE